MASHLEFQKRAIEYGAVSLVPMVDGTALTEIVAAFETSFSPDVVGGYGGIVPQHFKFGDLTKYYLGLEDRQWPAPGEVWLLGCECGEVGCWPLSARVTVTEATVVWSGFSQPHRKERDYSHLGPFEFDRAQYDAAVRIAVVDELRVVKKEASSRSLDVRDPDGNSLTEEQAREWYERSVSKRRAGESGEITEKGS